MNLAPQSRHENVTQTTTHDHASSALTVSSRDANGCCIACPGGVPPPSFPLLSPSASPPEILLPLLVVPGTGLDFLDPAGLPLILPRPGNPLKLPTGVAVPEPTFSPFSSAPVGVPDLRVHGILR